MSDLHARIQSIEPIRTPEDLQRHLQLAIEIEHATIPPYLTALYSLKQVDTGEENEWTFKLIKRVFVEEMLHFGLACNLLNAVKGSPRIAFQEFIPQYPHKLPQSDTTFDVSIERCSDEALATFKLIETPSFPVDKSIVQSDVGYRTIGEFYHNVRAGFAYLVDKIGDELFRPRNENERLQVGDDVFGGFGGERGGMVKVFDLASANQALDLIVDQGEGTRETQPKPGANTNDKPHFFMFHDIAEKQITIDDKPVSQFEPALVRQMIKDPRLMGSGFDQASHEFNSIYSDLLRALEKTFNGKPEAFGAAYDAMLALPQLAVKLMETEISGVLAGPTFRYIG